MDFGTVWNDDAQAWDLAIEAGDLLGDDGLTEAVKISLLTDRLADADDPLPDGSANRRGWWGDLPLPGAPLGGAAAQTDGDLTGCRWWLLARAKATEQTRQLFIQYAQEALQWLLDDGVAQAVDVQAVYQSRDILTMVITITRSDGSGQPVDRVFDAAWSATTGAVSVASR